MDEFRGITPDERFVVLFIDGIGRCSISEKRIDFFC